MTRWRLFAPLDEMTMSVLLQGTFTVLLVSHTLNLSVPASPFSNCDENMMLNFPATENVIFEPSTIETPLAKSAVFSGTGVATFCGSGTVVVS